MFRLYLHFFFFSLYGDHRDLHVLTHSFPTRRSSDLPPSGQGPHPAATADFVAPCSHAPVLLRKQESRVANDNICNPGLLLSQEHVYRSDVATRLALITLTGAAGTSPLNAPRTVAAGSTGASIIASTTSIPSTTWPNAA